jgi:hypothetical protein
MSTARADDSNHKRVLGGALAPQESAAAYAVVIFGPVWVQRCTICKIYVERKTINHVLHLPAEARLYQKLVRRPRQQPGR